MKLIIFKLLGGLVVKLKWGLIWLILLIEFKRKNNFGFLIR